MKVFLDIDIGDAARYEKNLAAYNRALEFLHMCGNQYGLPSTMAGLDAEALQLLQESYSSDPNWSSKGAAAFLPQDTLTLVQHQWDGSISVNFCPFQHFSVIQPSCNNFS
jgi:hypothetical protein